MGRSEVKTSRNLLLCNYRPRLFDLKTWRLENAMYLFYFWKHGCPSVLNITPRFHERFSQGLKQEQHGATSHNVHLTTTNHSILMSGILDTTKWHILLYDWFQWKIPHKLVAVHDTRQSHYTITDSRPAKLQSGTTGFQETPRFSDGDAEKRPWLIFISCVCDHSHTYLVTMMLESTFGKTTDIQLS